MATFKILESNREYIIKYENKDWFLCDENSNDLKPLSNHEKIVLKKILKLSGNRTYMGERNGYEIYVDNVSKLIHYYKNGREDFDKLLNSIDGKTFKIDEEKKHIFRNITRYDQNFYRFVLAIEVIMLLYGNNNGFRMRPGLTMEEVQEISSNRDDLFDFEKEIILNENFIENILPYYNETHRTYEFQKKLEKLNAKIYSKEEYEEKFGFDSVGLYLRYKRPYELQVKYSDDQNELNKTIFHEYIHSFQHTKYFYIEEASAELIRMDYTGNFENPSYRRPVKNLKLLIETIGPEPIWKMLFQSDPSDFENKIKSNMNRDDSNRLLYLLKIRPKMNFDDIDDDIESLIKILYENIYANKFEEDIYIQKILENNLYNRFYFNREKILSENPYYYVSYPENYNIFTFVVGKQLSYEEFINYENIDELYIESLGTIHLKNAKNQEYKYTACDGVTLPLEAGFELDEIKAFKIEFESQYYSDVLDYMSNRPGWTSGYKEYYYYDGEYREEGSYNKCPIHLDCKFKSKKIELPNIYDKFPDQVIMNEEEYIESKQKLLT